MRKLGVVDIPKEVNDIYWEAMRQPSETSRYLVVDYNSLDTDFFYKAYDEVDLKSNTEAEKLKEIYEGYDKEEETWGALLLIDIKTLKAYMLSKEIKYTKKEIK
jgi:hypothetical protein